MSDGTQETWDLELETVASLMLRGARAWQVAQALDCAVEEAEAAIARVRALWEQEAAGEPSEGPGRSLAHLRRIQLRAWERWDDAKDPAYLRLALDSERQIIGLRGQSVSGGDRPGRGNRFAVGLQWVPSGELMDKLAALPARQQQAVLRIVEAEMEGVALTRLLKTPYSCRWCGWVAGQSGQARDERKAMLAEHEETCERRGEKWRFVCALSTYYRKWARDETFQSALARAWEEVTAMAVVILKASTPAAARELRRQVHRAEKDTDRRLAAVAILDRAGVETAPKETRAHEGLVEYVDVTEGELAAIEDALRREAEGGGEAE